MQLLEPAAEEKFLKAPVRDVLDQYVKSAMDFVESGL